MANLVKTGTGINVVWGSADANVTGVAVSASERYTAETVPVLSNVGIPDGLVIIPGMIEANYEIYTQSGANLPEIGANITVGSQTVYVDSVEQMWEQKGISKIRVSGKTTPA